MLVTNVNVPAGGSIIVTLPFNSYVKILIDTVPGSPINDNYFKGVTT